MLYKKHSKPDPILIRSLDVLENTSEIPTLDQFFNPIHLFPCQRVVYSILTDALECLMGKGVVDGVSGAMLLREKGKVASEAFDWINDESQIAFSFRWCCFSLGWEYPEHIKRHMLKFTNHTLIRLSKTVKFSIWQKDRKNDIKGYRGALEVKGKRIDIGEYPSRKAAICALHREFILRGGVEWATATQ